MMTSVLQTRSSFHRYMIATITALAITSVSVVIDTRKEIRFNEQQTQALVDSIADGLDRQLQAWRFALSALSVSSTLTYPYNIDGFAREARQFSSITDANVAFYRADEDGIMLLFHTKAPVENLPKLYFAEQVPVFFKTMKEVQQSGLPGVTDLFIGPIVGEYIASMIISKTGTPNTNEMLSLNFTSRELSDLLGRIKLPAGYIVGVVDSNGVIGARSENLDAFVGKKIPDWYQAVISKNRSGSTEGAPVHGAAFNRYRFVFRHLNEAKGWAVSLLVPPTAYPLIALSISTILFGILSFGIANAVAWLLGSAQRQKADLERQYQQLSHHLLDELPGAVLRGAISDDGKFIVTLAVGKFSSELVMLNQFRFETLLLDAIRADLSHKTETSGIEFDVKEDERIYRLYVISSPLDSIKRKEYNLYILDITNQRSAEALAINSARLAALGQMAATLAHEMSQPINVISLAADNADYLIKQRDFVAAEEKVRKIREFSSKSRSLIDNLLSYARGDHKDRALAAVRLTTSVLLAHDLTHAFLSREKIKFTFQIAPQLHVLARPIELENIFVNLLMNSYDAYRQRPEIKDRLIRIVARQMGDHVEIEFVDNAGGIPPDLLSKIFEPFVTTKKEGHGTGLGLAFVSGNIRAWGGQISVDNIAVGARFKMVLQTAPMPELADA